LSKEEEEDEKEEEEEYDTITLKKGLGSAAV
jgi:hypothetical protein